MLIDLARLDQQAFDALYRDKVAPLFEAAGQDRAIAMRAFHTRVMLGAPAVLAVGAGIGFAFCEWMIAAFAAGVLALIGAGLAQGPLNRVRRGLKDKTLTALSAAIGATYQQQAHPDGVVKRCRALGLLASFDRASFEDWFTGERHACTFDLFLKAIWSAKAAIRMARPTGSRCSADRSSGLRFQNHSSR